MQSLEFHNVTLNYDAPKRGEAGLLALENLDLVLSGGQSIAIIGPSGCGKSSTLQMAAGLLQPTSGSVTVDGESVVRPRQSTALILQDFGLLPWKTVIKNAELGLKVRGVARDERRKRAREALALVGLAGFEDSYPGGLSGGMQQRLALARSLALDVDLLLMDEPLSALDALLREQLQDTLLELWKNEGYAQVLVTHSIEEAVYLGQRVYVLAPRPGHVVDVVENPHMGDKTYRGSDEFFALCTRIRSALHRTSSEAEERGEVLPHA